MIRLTASESGDDVRSGVEEEELPPLDMDYSAGRLLTLEMVNVFTTMKIEASMTAMKLVMFKARITLRMTNPGPARRLLEKGIFAEDF
jgi:hypothetical protein